MTSTPSSLDIYIYALMRMNAKVAEWRKRPVAGVTVGDFHGNAQKDKAQDSKNSITGESRHSVQGQVKEQGNTELVSLLMAQAADVHRYTYVYTGIPALLAPFGYLCSRSTRAFGYPRTHTEFRPTFTEYGLFCIYAGDYAATFLGITI